MCEYLLRRAHSEHAGGSPNPAGRGGRSDVFDLRGKTALDLAASLRIHFVVQVILDAEASFSDHNSNGYPSLALAIQERHLVVVRLMCAAEADLRNRRHMTAARPLCWQLHKGR